MTRLFTALLLLSSLLVVSCSKQSMTDMKSTNRTKQQPVIQNAITDADAHLALTRPKPLLGPLDTTATPPVVK